MKINLGCGHDLKPGVVGFDKGQYDELGDGVRYADLEEGIPLPDDSVTAIECHHVFEHIRDLEGLMREVIRVSADGCRLYFTVPHFTSNTFEFHVRQGFRRDMLKNYPEFQEKDVRLRFTGAYSFMNFVNRSWRLSNLYEYSFLRSFFFCKEVVFRATIRKKTLL